VVLAVIGFATLSALLWSLIRIPGGGGPDERTHLDLIERIREAGGIPLFQGFDHSQFVGTPGRIINAYELTPNLSALALAGLASLLRFSEPETSLLLGRLYAVCLFPFTLLLAYLTFRLLFPKRTVERVWGITALACLPQFMLVHSYVTNDTPTIAFATLAIYLTVRGWHRRFRRVDALLLGVALGLVGLHKANGLIVVPMAVALIAWKLRGEHAHLIRTLGIAAVAALAVSGWWYGRMLLMYGDAFGTETTRRAIEAVGTAVPTPRDQGLSPWDYANNSGWFEGAFRSFWAGYGVRRMTLPDAAYVAVAMPLALGALGLLAAIGRPRRRATGNGAIWAAFALGVAGLWILNFWTSWTLDGAAMHGRYTYPVIIPFVALLVAGLGRILAVTGRPSLLLALPIPLMLASNIAYFINVVVPDVVALRA